MILNPITRELFTDDGVFLKALHCPKRRKWSELRSEGGSNHRICDHCDQFVVDTSILSDAEMVQLFKEDTNVCVFVSVLQKNISVDPRPRPR